MSSYLPHREQASGGLGFSHFEFFSGLIHSGCLMLAISLSAPLSVAESESAFLELLNSVQSVRGGDGLESQEEGTGDSDFTDDVTDADTSARDYWISDVDPIVQGKKTLSPERWSCQQREAVVYGLRFG